jgi:hypothetical protein
MGFPGPGLRLERPKACETSIRMPVVEKIRVVRGPRGQMKKNIFHRELLTSLRLAPGKAKRAAKILTSNQQQTLQGLAGTSFVTRGDGSPHAPGVPEGGATKGGARAREFRNSQGASKPVLGALWTTTQSTTTQRSALCINS